jgi:type VI secretion system protein ImpH
MSATQRPARARLIDRLLAEPQRYAFFQAVRVLSRQVQRTEALPVDRVIGERIRFGSSLSLAFPPSEVESLREHAAGDTSPGRYRLVPAFMGMVGPGGAMPRYYTEALAERRHVQRDSTAHAFVDVFTNRMVALFYNAWQKYRLPLRHESGQRFKTELLSLAGYQLGLATQGGGEAVWDEPYAAYAGLLRHQPVAGENLRRVLADYFAVPVAVEQFVGQWFAIPPAQQTTLGQGAATLGESACCGERLWDRQTRVRLVIGPLRRAQYRALLPDGEAANALRRLLHYWCGMSVAFDVQLLLHRDDVQPARLDGCSGQLGRDAVSCTRPPTHHIGEARYLIQ